MEKSTSNVWRLAFDIRQRGQAEIQAILLPPFELIAEGFLRIKITLEIVQHLSLIHPLAQTDKEKIIPVSPVIIVFLRTHRRVHDVLQSRVTGKILIYAFHDFRIFHRIGRDQLLAYRRFVTEDLSRHAFRKDYAVGLIQRALASFEHIETEHFQDSGSHVPRIFLVARPLSAILYIEKTAFGPSTQKASFLYKRRRPGKRPRERTADNGLRPFASVHDIHPEDSIGVRVAAVERIIIIHLHHNEHKRHKSNAQPQHIQNRSRLEPAEHTKEISQNRFHIQLFCFNTNKKYAK